MSFEKSVWETLSAVDVSKHIEKKINLSYLSWAWAWGTLMEYYPESHYNFDEPKTLPDNSVMVACNLTIKQGDKAFTRKMWLPVMDNKNNAIINPDARKISDSMMRCLVKVIGICGLGLYIYAGEDLPEASKPNIGELQSKIVALGISIEEFCSRSKVRSLADIPVEKYEAALRFAASMVADKE